MVFSKTFPKNVGGSNYPRWEEVQLTDIEENEVDAKARQENLALMKQCIEDAKAVAAEKGVSSQGDMTSIAISLFEKRASHSVYWKERAAKEKFDRLHKA